MPASMIPPKHYSMKLDGGGKNIINSMNVDRKLNVRSSCEVVLISNKTKHYAHKFVLVSFSDYFRNYFEEKTEDEESLSGKDSEKSQSDDEIASLNSNGTSESSVNTNQSAISRHRTTINLPGINPEELALILDYMYTSQIVLSAQNVNEILLVGCLLQISSVIEFCAEVLLKQPTWRSPLVSPRLLNFVTGQGMNIRPANEVSSSPTAVTWATSGGRPMSHEMKPQKQVNKSDVVTYTESCPAGTSRQSSGTAGQARNSRKRRYPESKTSSSEKQDRLTLKRGNSFGQRFENRAKVAPSIEEQQQEYLANIDFAELDRELSRNALLNSRRYRSSVHNFSQDFSAVSGVDNRAYAPTPLVDIKNVNYKQETPIIRKGSANNETKVTKESRCLEYSRLESQAEAEEARSSNLLMESRAVTAFPQITDCDRNLSALWFPMLHPGYFGLPMNPIHRTGYAPTFPGIARQGHPFEKTPDLSNVSFIPTQMEEKQPPLRRYDASFAGIYTNPAILREYENSRIGVVPTLHSGASEVLMKRTSVSHIQASPKTKERAEYFPSQKNQFRPGDSNPPSYETGFRRFCPDIIRHRNFSSTKEKNICKSPTALSLSAEETYIPTDTRNPRKHQFDIDKEVTSNSAESSLVLSSQEEWQTWQTSPAFQNNTSYKGGVSGLKNSKIDYHKRKRKLLRAAEEMPKHERVKQDETRRNPSHPVTKARREQIKCSSEDDIIARECLHSDASDLDSDDSGRPSSV